MERDEDKSGKRINRLVKLWIFLAVFLIVGNLVLLYVADHRNHPYLFFLKDLIGWLTVDEPSFGRPSSVGLPPPQPCLLLGPE